MHEAATAGLCLSYGDAPYDIHLEAVSVGRDILAAVSGGTRAHIGAVALAEPADAVHPVTGVVAGDGAPPGGAPPGGAPPGGAPPGGAPALDGPCDPATCVGGALDFGASRIREPATVCEGQGHANLRGTSGLLAAGDGASPGGVPRVSALAAYGHKDAVLAEMFARGLCGKYGVNVCVSAGVHVDGASADEIALMMENAERLLAELSDL